MAHGLIIVRCTTVYKKFDSYLESNEPITVSLYKAAGAGQAGQAKTGPLFFSTWFGNDR